MKSYTKIFFIYIGYVTIKVSKHLRINIVNPLYLILNKVNRHFEKINWNNYLTLAPTNKSKEKIKKYEQLWGKIIIRLITKKYKNQI